MFNVIFLFLACAACHIPGIVPANSSISPATAQLYDDNDDNWLFRLNRSTPEQLISWFKNPQESVNLINKNGISLLHWVMTNETCKQNPVIQQTLLARADLEIDIKGTHKGDGNDTTLGIQIYTLLQTQPQHPSKSKEKLRIIKKLQERGARIDNISDSTKKVLQAYAQTLQSDHTTTIKHSDQLTTTFEKVFDYFAKA